MAKVEKPVITSIDGIDGDEKHVYENGREFIQHKNGSRSITLRDGKTATIREGKGQDVRRAADEIDSAEKSKYLLAIMAAVTVIDGQPIPMEDFDQLPGKDYTRIQTEVSDLNF